MIKNTYQKLKHVGYNDYSHIILWKSAISKFISLASTALK